jgi:hypothetical protein
MPCPFHPRLYDGNYIELGIIQYHIMTVFIKNVINGVTVAFVIMITLPLHCLLLTHIRFIIQTSVRDSVNI